jgi:threonine synthase
MARPWRGVIEEYRERLPVTDDTPVVTLHEGGTPLLRSASLSAETGCEVFLKYEGTNPTGSFKDRGMTVAISRALEDGARAVVCASTGNTSASAAAYAARAGIPCGVVLPRGRVAAGKLAQALVHGARLLEVDANFDRALEVVRNLADRHPVTLVNSVNPDRIEGQKTLAFEVCDALGGPPDYHLVPVGNAGNIVSHWRGYREEQKAARIPAAPVLLGFQSAGAAPIVEGHPIADPRTIATAIRIGNPASWEGAEKAAAESGGEVAAVTDRDILRAYRRMAAEGVFCEMASASSVAGLLQAVAAGRIERGRTAVCVLTGHGLTDPEGAVAGSARARLVPADPDAVAEVLDL